MNWRQRSGEAERELTGEYKQTEAKRIGMWKRSRSRGRGRAKLEKGKDRKEERKEAFRI